MAHFTDLTALHSSRTLKCAAVLCSQESLNCTHVQKSLARKEF